MKGKLVRLPPVGRGVKDEVVDIADYESRTWNCVPIAIPSKAREDLLCEQALNMLQSYEYDVTMVHVFVDATHVRTDGANEYEVYFKYIRKRGYDKVNVHPGGVGLRKQYESIFRFFCRRSRDPFSE